MRELMFTTTGRSCFTSGASEGMGPTCLTASAVVVGADGAAWASAAKIVESVARRWHADTSGSAAIDASAPVQRAIRTVKRRCMQPPRDRSPEEQRSLPCISTRRARNDSRARQTSTVRNVTPAHRPSSGLHCGPVSVLGDALQLVARGAQVLQLHALA